MTIAYTLTINEMSCLVEIEGRENVVNRVLWTLTGTEGELSAFYSTVTVPPFDPEAKFTPFEALDEATVRGWIDAETEVQEKARQHIQTAIEDQRAPKVVTPPRLPWEPEPEPVEAAEPDED